MGHFVISVLIHIVHLDLDSLYNTIQFTKSLISDLLFQVWNFKDIIYPML